MGTACGPQWAQIPSFASRNQSGYWYCLERVRGGLERPGGDRRRILALRRCREGTGRGHAGQTQAAQEGRRKAQGRVASRCPRVTVIRLLRKIWVGSGRLPASWEDRRAGP